MKKNFRITFFIILITFTLGIIASCSGNKDNTSDIQSSEDNMTSEADKYPYLSGFENSYTQAYIYQNKNKVYNLQQNKGITFITVQDVHVSSLDDSRYDQLRDIVIITEQLDVDYVIVLGDLTSSLYDHDTAIDLIKKVKEIMDQCHCPVYYTRGDHEYNATDENWGTNEDDYNNIVTGMDWYNIFGIYDDPNVVIDSSNPYGCYFYVDIPELKNRVIVLNSFEFKANPDGLPYINDDGTMGYWVRKVGSKEQVKWLTKKALDMTGKTDWTVTFFSHMIPYKDTSSEVDTIFHGYATDNTPLRKIVQAFKNGSSWSGEYNDDVGQISVDFSEQGKIAVAGWWSGHIHDDCFKRVDDLNMFVSTNTCAHYRDSWAEDENPVHLPPERNDTDKAMSVNMFIVDYTEQAVNVVKFGSESAQGMTKYFEY